jgi:type IV pilus assembly protein PilM
MFVRFPKFGIIKKSCLGVDIGSSAIKVVELSRWGERIKLEAYGEMRAEAAFQKSFRTLEKNTLLLQSQDVGKAIKGIIEEAKMSSKRVVFSIPDFSTFYTTFDLPPMSPQEIPQAVRFRARQQIPLPLNEVSLDWAVIQGGSAGSGEGQGLGLRVLLVAVPNEIINQYQEITKLCNLELYAIEAEVFGFLRSVFPDKRKIIVLIDIGAQSSTCSLVDKGVLKQSRSFEPAGNEITDVLSKALQVDFNQAEELKKKYGLLTTTEPGKENIHEIISTIVDAMLTEVEKSLESFSLLEDKIPESVVLGGGIALLPGLKEYFTKRLSREVEVANPFLHVFYPPILEKTLKEMGPSYAIAVGAAMRGLE